MRSEEEKRKKKISLSQKKRFFGARPVFKEKGFDRFEIVKKKSLGIWFFFHVAFIHEHFEFVREKPDDFHRAKIRISRDIKRRKLSLDENTKFKDSVFMRVFSLKS